MRQVPGLGLATVLALAGAGCSHSKPSSPPAQTAAPATVVQDDGDEGNDPTAPPRSDAKLTADQARDIALAQYPGTIVESELEREHGHLIFSIEIKLAGHKGVKEVNVDAIDGSIVNVEDEDDDDDDDDGKPDADD